MNAGSLVLSHWQKLVKIIKGWHCAWESLRNMAMAIGIWHGVRGPCGRSNHDKTLKSAKIVTIFSTCLDSKEWEETLNFN